MGRESANQPRDPRRTISVVSGLPRSGTSMMMQMLEAAGFDLARDAAREADADNPRGYYELEAVRRLPTETAFLASTIGRVVKIVSPLLRHLPAEYDYRVVFMERDLGEVLASQRAMLDRQGLAVAETPDEAEIRRAFEAQSTDVRAWLSSQSHVRVLFVAHTDVLQNPVATSEHVLAFLEPSGIMDSGRAANVDRATRAAAMARAVETSLHRQRRGSAPDA